jgi:hypothetical protein
LRSLIQDAAHQAKTELKVEVEVTGTNTILELVRKKIGYTVLRHKRRRVPRSH